MKFIRKITSLVVISAIFCFLPSLAQAYWIWTPRTGTWVNPAYTVKPNPKEQLEVVKELFNKKDYQGALKEAKQLLRYYPGSVEAPEAQFYLGACLENLDKPYGAYLAYQRVIDKYPFSQRTDDVVEREFKIGERLLEAPQKKILGVNISYESLVLEIFNKVIDNSPYGRYAAIAQYKTGLILKGLKSFDEAQNAFQKVVDNYPKSEWADASKFQIASCQSLSSLRPDYDQVATEEAKKGFEDFAREHPDLDAGLSKKIEDNLSKLREKEAQANLKIAQFYERQKQYASAKIYYKYIIDNYTDTSVATTAAARFQILERK
ncbi:MAG: tetratricopeptide repeat protein [Candidatus Omnitrophota bacterium]